MSNYFASDEFEGERPFKCYVCRKMLIMSLEGEYKIQLKCPRCKTRITLETCRQVPMSLAVKEVI